MKRFWIILVLASAFVTLTACNRKSQAEQLAALDSAYKSGVLSKEEYDVKKAALMGPTAAPPAPPVAVPPTAPAAPAAPVTTTGPSAPEPAPSKGCEDAEYKSAKSGKQSRFFPVSEPKAKRAALSALATLGFAVQKDSGTEIEASKRTGGEREILQFKAAEVGGKHGTRVTGETKKSVTGHAAQKSWTGAVLAQIACNLR